MSGEPRASRGHVPVLDGVRGLAIALVLSVHFVGDATPTNGLQRALVKLANYGVWGVDLFFVLSGFLITGILLDSRGTTSYYRSFYVRRALRIFPLYYGVLGLLFVVWPMLAVGYPAGLTESAAHQGWAWSYLVNVYVALHRTWALPYVSHSGLSRSRSTSTWYGPSWSRPARSTRSPSSAPRCRSGRSSAGSRSPGPAPGTSRSSC